MTNETMQKAVCAYCGWRSRRKTGQIVVCPECENIATYEVE